MPANTGGTQITELALTVYIYSSKKGKEFPPERKSKVTQEIVSSKSWEIQTAYSCLMRKAPLRSIALSMKKAV